MVLNSINDLLNEFPYFLNKNESSNFYKSQKVTYNQLNNLLEDLFKVKNSFKLNKNIWIYKEQDEPHYYCMHFYFGFPLIKNIKIYRENELVYDASFELNSDKESSFLVHEDFPEHFIKVDENEDGELTYIPLDIYTTDYNSEDNVQSVKIDIYSYSQNTISNDDYFVKVTTFEGFTIEKGFPENDSFMGNAYDHDLSLDEIGESNNIPRKKYILVENEDLYFLCEPPYHNRLTEDDYHYMQRMLNYALKLHEMPLPCAEIYKLYGLEATLTNRERFLLRMVDMNKHPEAIVYNDEGEIIDFTNEWMAKPWEHNDTLCFEKQDEIYFFVNVNNGTPLRGTIITFTFKFVNMFNESQNTDDYIIIPYLDDEPLDYEIRDTNWSFDTTNLSDEDNNIFTFKCYHADDLNNPIFISSEIPIILRDCKNGNFYVNPTSGNDNNSGSKENPFKTIKQALQSIDEVSNVIVLQSGTHLLTDKISVDYNCNIVSCDSAIIENNDSPIFFSLNLGCNLLLRNIGFKHKNINYTIKEHVYTNENHSDMLNVMADTLNSKLSVNVDKKEYIINDTLVKISGKLLDEDQQPISNKNISLKLIDETTKEAVNLGVISTDEKGNYNYEFDLWDKIDVKTQDYSITADYEDDFKYLTSNKTVSFKVVEVPITLSCDKTLILPGEYTTVTAKYLEMHPLDLYVDDELIETNTTDETGTLTRKFLGGGYGKHKIKAKYGLTTSNELTIEDLIYYKKSQRITKGTPFEFTYDTEECFSIELSGYLNVNVSIIDELDQGIKYTYDGLNVLNTKYSISDSKSNNKEQFSKIPWASNSKLRVDFKKYSIEVYLNNIFHKSFVRKNISKFSKFTILQENGTLNWSDVGIKINNLKGVE